MADLKREEGASPSPVEPTPAPIQNGGSESGPETGAPEATPEVPTTPGYVPPPEASPVAAVPEVVAPPTAPEVTLPPAAPYVPAPIIDGPPVQPTLSSVVAGICSQYESRLEACRQGVASPIQLVNQSWPHFASLDASDKKFLGDQVIAAVKQLQDRLLKEYKDEVARAIGR